MANPQIENGYTKIANEILNALARYRIPGEQMQCLLFIIRKTYGYGKKEDYISNSQFVKATGLNKVAVCRAIKSLIDKKIVNKKDNRKIPSYCFNKNYSKWIKLTKKITVNKKDNAVNKKDNKLLTKKIPTKEKKENIQKKYSKEIFCCVISYLNSKTGKNFKIVNGNTKYIQARLNEGYELEDFIKVIDNQINNQWFKDNPMYLRPQTLFNSEKFHGYIENNQNNSTISDAERTRIEQEKRLFG